MNQDTVWDVLAALLLVAGLALACHLADTGYMCSGYDDCSRLADSVAQEQENLDTLAE